MFLIFSFTALKLILKLKLDFCKHISEARTGKSSSEGASSRRGLIPGSPGG